MSVWKHPRARIAALIPVLFFPLALLCGEPGDPSTSRARRLGEVGATITLDRSFLENPETGVVIDNRTVQTMRDRGLITICSEPAADWSATDQGSDAKSTKTAPDRRAHWRRKTAAQRRRITKAEAAVEKIDARIDALVATAFGGGKGTAKTWARIDEARGNRKIAAARLSEERKDLARLIREARKEGAQPGWFR